jgi:hypothetical protein
MASPQIMPITSLQIKVKFTGRAYVTLGNTAESFEVKAGSSDLFLEEYFALPQRR